METPDDRRPSAPSMDDVARLAGVHQTTVSRALRNDPRITLAVRERVEAAAAQLGYRPNPLLAALGTMRRRRATVAYQTCLAYIMRSGPARAILDAHLSGARQAAERRGFRLEPFVMDDDLREGRLDGILQARNIQGVIVGPLPEAHGNFTLDWSRLCTVVIEYSFTQPAFDRVVTDSYATMNMAIAECRRRGFSRLGVVLAQVVDERNEGLLSAAFSLAREKDRRIAAIPRLILPGWQEDAMESWMRRWRPEVIISSNALLPSIQTYLERRRIRVPAQVGLLNLNVASDMNLSGICQDAPGIGAAAVRLVIEKLNHNDFGIPKSRVTLLTEGMWHEGNTLARG